MAKARRRLMVSASTIYTIERRSFLAGLGALLVAKMPPVPTYVRLIRPVPQVSLTRYYPCTLLGILEAIRELGDQLKRYGDLLPEEREPVAAQIDEALSLIRPIGVRVNVKASLEDIVAGKFAVAEHDMGELDIVPLALPSLLHS